MDVTYTNRPTSMWYCAIYLMVGRPANWILLMFVPVFLAFGALRQILMQHPETYLIWFVAITLMWIAFMALIQGLVVLPIVFGKQPRMYRTLLTQEGVIQIVAENIIALPWSTIKEIRQHNGNVYFWKSGRGVGIWVPNTAFSNVAEAQRFADAGNAARRGNFSMLNEPIAVASTTPVQTDVWPPPPSQ